MVASLIPGKHNTHHKVVKFLFNKIPKFPLFILSSLYYRHDTRAMIVKSFHVDELDPLQMYGKFDFEVWIAVVRDRCKRSESKLK